MTPLKVTHTESSSQHSVDAHKDASTDDLPQQALLLQDIAVRQQQNALQLKALAENVSRIGDLVQKDDKLSEPVDVVGNGHSGTAVELHEIKAIAKELKALMASMQRNTSEFYRNPSNLTISTSGNASPKTGHSSQMKRFDRVRKTCLSEDAPRHWHLVNMLADPDMKLLQVIVTISKL